MNQSVKVSKAISYVVMVCAVLLFAMIWPVGIFQQTYVSKSNEIIAMESDPVNVEHNVTQMFVGEGGELSAVDLYVCNDMRGETITFRLYDSSYTEIFNTFHVVKNDQKFPDFVHIPVGYDLEKDQEYYFTLEGLSTDMIVAYEARETSTSIVNGFMSYGGIELQRYNVVIRYEYSNPFVWWQVLLFGVLIAAVTAGALWLIKKVFEQTLTDREVKVQTVFRVTLSPVVVLGGVILCLMIFPGRKFGTGMVNYAIYGTGILLFMAVLLIWVHYKRTGMDSIINKNDMVRKIPEFLQSVCFAGVLWSCYEYMNGLYDIHHYIATRKMLIWFMLSLLCTFSKKELLRIWTILWLVVSGIACYFYAKPYFGIEEEGELYKLQAYLIVAGGLVILLLLIKLFRILRKKDTINKQISIPYLLLFAAMMGLMIFYRNQRDWILALVVLFVIFYLRMWTWERSDRILETFVNGIILNFIYMVGYSLVHRPYHKYIYHRYGLGFHTVTMTGVYLSLVLSAVFVRFLMQYRKKGRLIDTIGELILVGVGNVYLFITLSRTGYLATIVMEVFMLFLFVLTEKKKKLLLSLKVFCTVIGVTILFFPIVFTMTRIMPALFNDPVLADVECTGWHIKKGTPTDSELYMDLEYFLKKANVKVLGAEEEAASLSYKENQLLLQEMWSAVFPSDIRVVDDTVLLASIEDDIENQGLNEVTNGRVEIFREYIKHWNMTGHEAMWIEDANGAVIVHAHNVFLQIIHDHGLPTGIAFILFGAVSLGVAIICFLKKQRMDMALTIAILLAFAVSGLAEWNFHLCNPFGPAVFIAITPLLLKNKDRKCNE